MLKKQGRWVQNRIRTWWPKKCMLHAEHTAGSSDHISFRAESFFLKIPLRTLIRSAPLPKRKMPFGNVLIPESVEWAKQCLSKLMFLKANSKILWRLTRFNGPHFPTVLVYFNFRKCLFYLCHKIIICQVHFILCAFMGLISILWNSISAFHLVCVFWSINCFNGNVAYTFSVIKFFTKMIQVASKQDTFLN